MIYQGSKARCSRELVPIMQQVIDRYNVKTYIEPFCGGCNIIDKIRCENKYAYDINSELIALLKYIQADNTVSIAPNDCSFELYKDVRENRKQGTAKYSVEFTELIGFCASYGGRYFDGGYGRDKTGKRNIYAERVAELRRQAPNLQGIRFEAKSFTDLNISDFCGCMFYMDPPYKNTKKYTGQGIDYDNFYDFCIRLAEKNFVFISEYDMPDTFIPIWQKTRKVYQKSDRMVADDAVEKLFMVNRE